MNLCLFFFFAFLIKPALISITKEILLLFQIKWHYGRLSIELYPQLFMSFPIIPSPVLTVGWPMTNLITVVLFFTFK